MLAIFLYLVPLSLPTPPTWLPSKRPFRLDSPCSKKSIIPFSTPTKNWSVPALCHDRTIHTCLPQGALCIQLSHDFASPLDLSREKALSYLSLYPLCLVPLPLHVIDICLLPWESGVWSWSQGGIRRQSRESCRGAGRAALWGRGSEEEFYPGAISPASWGGNPW